MKFLLKTSCGLYDKEKKEKLEKLGFQFETEDYNQGKYWMLKEFDDEYKPTYLKINTLKELLDFRKEWNSIIIYEDSETSDLVLEIYDGWRE